MSEANISIFPTIPPITVTLPTTRVGQLITVQDSSGTASLTNQIQISTLFADGLSSITIEEPYGSRTFIENPTNTYSVVNTFGFPATSKAANINTLRTENITYIDETTSNPLTTYIQSGHFFINGTEVGDITAVELQSTVTGLGTAGYLSTIPDILPIEPVLVVVGNPGIPGITLQRSSIQFTNNGTNWSNASYGYSQLFNVQGNAVLYADGQFVAVGEDTSGNNIQWSTDGSNWNYTSPAVASTDIRYQVSYGNGLWHAVGTGATLYSQDGRSWNTTPLSNMYGIAYGQNTWVLGGGGIYFSQDGLDWNSATIPSFVDTVFDIGYDGNKFLAIVSTINPTSPTVLYSVNGSNWNYHNITGAVTWRYVYGNGQIWVAAGSNTSYSTDGGFTWLPTGLPTVNSFTRPYWDGNLWWMGQLNSGQSILTSLNGSNWQNAIIQQGGFQGGAYGFASIPSTITGCAYVLPSTVAGLSSAGYISSTQLASTVAGIEASLAPAVQTVSTAFQYTGFDQTFIVPGNISTLEFYMWGAGGGGGGGSIFDKCVGGGAAFQQGKLVVNPFDNIQIVVGQGGINGNSFYFGSAPITGTYGGGGAGASGAGAGGGRSAIILNNKEIVTAGGGGGGSYNVIYDGNVGSANGDGSTSSKGGGETGYTLGGTGGSSTISGLGGTGNENGQNGYYLHGGAGSFAAPGNIGGGGGGGGYFGGGGGGHSFISFNQGGGGGGGGSYYNSNYVRNFQSENGSLNVPGGTTNLYYQPNVGRGSPYLSINDGGSGLIVFVYTTITVKPQVSPGGEFKNLYVENLATNTIQVRQPQTPLYVATGNASGTVGGIQYSIDGSNWNIANISPSPFGFSRGYNAYWNGSYWLAVSQDGNNGAIKYSQDGSNWINSGIGTFNNKGLAITWNGQYWVAVGDSAGGSFTTMLYSYDGFTWLPASNPFSQNCYGVAWNGQIWVAVGYGATNQIKYSYNGSNWIDSVDGNLIVGYCVAWNGQLWVAMGLSLQYSYNGSNWFNCTGQSFNPVAKAVAWNGEYWLAVGRDSLYTVLASPDGISWSTTLPNGQSVLPNAPITEGNGVMWDGTKWFITGTNSGTASIKYSGKDQTGNFTWIDATSGGFSGGGNGIAYNNPQTPFLQNSNLALYNRTNTQPLYDTPSNNFIKTTQTSLNINNALYVNVSTIASTNVTYFNSKVGIFQPNPTYDLELVHDSAFKPGTATWTTTSDRRVKENIQGVKLETCVSTLMALPLRTFSYCSSFTQITGVSQEQRYGLIAQEVQIPHTVTTKPAYGFNDFHYLNTDQIHYIHLGATQALLEHVQEQESTIEGLQQMILTKNH